MDALLLVLAALLLLTRLGNQCLWQDEAQTALVARTILTHGVPLGDDGRNSFSQEAGKELGPGKLYVWHPWLPFYVLAGFFAVLGPGTFAARLPFALFGIATVLLTYHLGTRLWRSRRIGLLAAVVLLLNVPFLILARQCRYYAPGMFFALLALYGYTRLLERRRYGAITFAAAAIALFHTHYVQYAALLATVAVHAALFHRDRLRALGLAAGASALVSAPWMIWFASLGRTVSTFAGPDAGALRFLLLYLVKLGQYVFPPLLLLIVPVALWQRRRERRGRAAAAEGPRGGIPLLLLFTAVTLVAIWLTSPVAFFRYLTPVIPAGCLVVAWLLDALVRLRRVPGTLAVLALLPALGYAWRMPDYLYEITHDYVGPVDGIVRYLREHAHADDVVAITYDDLPVKFYTGLRVVGGLTGEDLAPARTARWVIIRKYLVSEQSAPVYEYLLSQLPLQRYRAELIPAPDTPYQNREEPDMHQFRTVQAPPVVILQRSNGVGP